MDIQHKPVCAVNVNNSAYSSEIHSFIAIYKPNTPSGGNQKELHVLNNQMSVHDLYYLTIRAMLSDI